MSAHAPRHPMAVGTLLAVLAAVSFGAVLPLVARAGRGVGPLTTAALLYAGACLAAAVAALGPANGGAPLGRAQLTRVVGCAALGALLAPTLLAFGLQRADSAVASLLLCLEALFTALAARVLLGEPLGGRLLAALALIGAGGAWLTVDAARTSGGGLVGALAVGGATLAWALDNVLARPLAEHAPLSVVAAKGALGAGATASLALLFGEPAPSFASAATLLACGATGYGLSLALYLLAQRRIGAARTGSVFAIAPFVGALVAWLSGAGAPGASVAAAAALLAAGVYLHATEHHAHPHHHDAVEHEHPHRHDDGHHAHAHDPPVAGEHSHPHRHEALEHDHAHAPDVHHTHGHP